MVVSGIVNTISGEEIQDPLSVRPKQFGPLAMRKRHVHLQHVKQPHPLRVYRFGIKLVTCNESWHGPDARLYEFDGVTGCSLRIPAFIVRMPHLGHRLAEMASRDKNR